jgi:hypothetical protein
VNIKFLVYLVFLFLISILHGEKYIFHGELDGYIYEKKGDRLLLVSPKDIGVNETLRLFWTNEAKDCTLEYYLEEEGVGLGFRYILIAVHPNGLEGKYKQGNIFWSPDLDFHKSISPQPNFGKITIIE